MLICYARLIFDENDVRAEKNVESHTKKEFIIYILIMKPLLVGYKHSSNASHYLTEK